MTGAWPTAPPPLPTRISVPPPPACSSTQPTAVVCTSDSLASALIRVVRESGRSVPEDLSVIGFDDSLLATLASPALTSVRVDYTAFGAAASAALLAVIDGEDAPVYQPAAADA